MFRKKRSHAESADFELNLASIIDCFTVLITYLLASASFISLGVMDVGVASQGEQAPGTPEPAVTVSVRLEDSRSLILKVEGAESRVLTLPPKGGNWDLEAMKQNLQALHERWPTLNGAMVAAEDRVEYRDLVKSVEAVRATLGSASLGEVESL